MPPRPGCIDGSTEPPEALRTTAGASRTRTLKSSVGEFEWDPSREVTVQDFIDNQAQFNAILKTMLPDTDGETKQHTAQITESCAASSTTFGVVAALLMTEALGGLRTNPKSGTPWSELDDWEQAVLYLYVTAHALSSVFALLTVLLSAYQLVGISRIPCELVVNFIRTRPNSLNEIQCLTVTVYSLIAGQIFSVWLTYDREIAPVPMFVLVCSLPLIIMQWKRWMRGSIDFMVSYCNEHLRNTKHITSTTSSTKEA